MDLSKLIYLALMAGLVSLVFWVKPKELTKNGKLCAFFRGYRIASPLIVGTYLYVMYDLVFLDCVSDTAGKLFAGSFYTLIFVVPLPYFLTRKVILEDGCLHGYSIFTGKKSLKIDDITSIKDSKLWGGMVISTANSRIVIERFLSGSEALIDHVINDGSSN